MIARLAMLWIGAVLATSACQAGLVISEIMYSPFDDGREWFQVFNTGGTAIDLKEVDVLVNKTSLGAIDAVIAPGQFVVLLDGTVPTIGGGSGLGGPGSGVDPIEQFLDLFIDPLDQAAFRDSILALDPWNSLQPAGFPAPNATIEIVDQSTNSVLTSVSGFTEDPFPEIIMGLGSPPAGQSIVLKDLSLDDSDGANWQTASEHTGKSPDESGLAVVRLSSAPQQAGVPEPGTFAMFGLSFIAGGLGLRNRSKGARIV